MNFGYPKMLWLALAVGPLLILFFWWTWKKRQRLITAFIQARLLPNLLDGVSPFVQKSRMILTTLAVILLFMAVARPQWGFAWEEARQRGRDIIVAIDTSRSMLAEDITPNRLTRAKLAALDLARLAKTDRLALVAFAGTAFLQAPLTLDDEAFRQSVNILDIGIIPQGGSSLAEAIETALAAFKDEGDNHKILVLFSDGEEHEPQALEAAKKAAEKGMRIFTIGVGTPNGELLRQADEKGVMGFIKDDQGNAVKSSLNEKLLQQIATTANGFYLPLQGARTIDVLYQRGLAPLPTTESSTQMVRQYKERFQWPLGIAILLLVTEVLIRDRRKRSSPASGTSQPAKTMTAQVATVFLLGLSVLPATASTSKALQDYRSGRFKEAQQEYEKQIEKRPDDPRLHYNAGAAAYQNHDYEKASKEFQSALVSPDLKLQQKAYYNLGNSQYRAGEDDEDLNKKLESWETAVKHFDSAFKLNPKDEDARFNRELVKQRVEELKKQQQQQKQQNKPDKNQDKKDDQEKDKNKQDQQQDQKQDKDKQDQQKSEQDKKDEQQQQKNQQDQDKQKQEQQQKGEEKDKQKGDGKDDQPPQPPKEQPGSEEKSEKPEEEEGASPVQLGKMSPEQARKLLEAAKAEEKALLFIPPAKKDQKNRPRIFKDW
jgi:Ca-activated chloride channel family protein